MKIEMTKGGSRRHPNQPCYRTAASHSLDLYFISKVMCSKYVKIIHVFELHVFSDVQCFGDPEFFMKAKHAEHPHDLLRQNMTKSPTLREGLRGALRSQSRQSRSFAFQRCFPPLCSGCGALRLRRALRCALHHLGEADPPRHRKKSKAGLDSLANVWWGDDG